MNRPADGFGGRSWLMVFSVVVLIVAALVGDPGIADRGQAVTEDAALGPGPTLLRQDDLAPQLAQEIRSAHVGPDPAVEGPSRDQESASPDPDLSPEAEPGPPTDPESDQVRESDRVPQSEPEPERRPLVINAVGDVNVDPNYIPTLATEGYDHALAGMDGLFMEDDLTIINLECPASQLGAIVPKQFNFRCDVDALPSLRRLGVDVANQGNNHILDYGPDAMLDSLVQLRQAGIEPVGAGRNAAEAHRPAVFDIGGWTIAVVGFGGVVPGSSWIAAEDRPGMADGDTIETMVAAVEAADAVADLVAVTIHWGVELQSGPPADDVARAEAMIDAGADMIFGHHPHRLNELEFYNDRPVSWSLGNFIWPRLSAAGSDTAVAQVIVEPTGAITACYLPVTIISHGHPTLDDPATRSC